VITRFLTPDPFPVSHIALNRGKRSLTLDLRAPQGPDVLRRLAAGFDEDEIRAPRDGGVV